MAIVWTDSSVILLVLFSNVLSDAAESYDIAVFTLADRYIPMAAVRAV